MKELFKSDKFETGVRVSLAFVAAFLFFGIVIAICGHDPLDAFVQLFVGAFGSGFNFGMLLEWFILIMIVGSGYSLTKRIGYFNLGLEGSLYLGAMFSAGVGFLAPELPKYIIQPLCILTAFVVAAAYGSVCGVLKAYLNVNEACTTILMNYVAQYFCDYLVTNPWQKPGSPMPQTPDIQPNALFTKLPFAHSRASYAIVVAILVFAFVCFLTFKTTFGFRLRMVATNPRFAEAAGIKSKKTVLLTVMLSCGIGGIAGACQIMGIYGCFMQNFSQSSAFQGIIACLLVNNNLLLFPLSAFFVAFTKAGGAGMEYYTGISSALIFTVVPLLILFVSMDKMFDYKRFFRFIRTRVLRRQNTPKLAGMGDGGDR